MAIYVDRIRAYSNVAPAARRYGSAWCHCWADTEAELDAMADRIGLDRRHCQDRKNPTLRHYDLTPAKRARAVAAGAVEMEYLDYLRAKQRESANA